MNRLGLVLSTLVTLSVWASTEQPATVTPPREGYVTTGDDVRLFYKRVGIGRAVGVVLHGGPGSNINAVWPDLERLAGTRTIVLYDQRGSGRSQIIKDPARLTSAHHVRDLDAIRVHLGLQRFALIGESWGAGLAVLYAAAHPEQVERLLLIGPMPPTRAILERRLDESDQAMGLRRQLAEVRRTMVDTADPVATCREFFALYLKQFFATPEGMARRRGSSCDAPPESVRNYFVVNDATLTSLGAWDFRPLLAGLTMPAMVIEGAQSPASTLESARVMAQALPNATLVLVPGAGHYPQVEQPARFFEAVEKFLTPTK
jgi:proline iminopeptidase